MAYLIHLEKENFKFSGTHFTILSSSHGERMHGHNYQVRVSLLVKELDPHLGMPFDFNLIKPIIKRICDELDEYILIPTNSPYLGVEKEDSQVNIQFLDKNYSLPAEDVRLLPIVNTTAEELARYVYERLRSEAQVDLAQVRVTIEESLGQSVTYISDEGSENPISTLT